MDDPSSYVPEPPPARSTPDLPENVGTVGDANKDAFSVKAINIHFRTRGRDIGTKTNQRAKQGTISRQFGPPNSDEKSGSFARFMAFLGPRYLEDARELLGRNTLRRIETEMTKKHKKDRKPPPGQSEFIQLSTMVKLLETVLIVLREYPPFDALCRVPGKSDDKKERCANNSFKTVGVAARGSSESPASTRAAISAADDRPPRVHEAGPWLWLGTDDDSH